MITCDEVGTVEAPTLCGQCGAYWKCECHSDVTWDDPLFLSSDSMFERDADGTVRMKTLKVWPADRDFNVWGNV